MGPEQSQQTDDAGAELLVEEFLYFGRGHPQTHLYLAVVDACAQETVRRDLVQKPKPGSRRY